jgi:hypothetical protein
MEASVQEYIVELAIDRQELQRLYQGRAQVVITRDTLGRCIQFPAAALRPFVSHAGVHGRFNIRVGADHRLLGISRSSS